jgi:hypothetical protein
MHNKKPTSESADDYETPNYVWDLILKHVPKNAVIYEPFYLNGRSGEYIKSKGYNCIHEDTDFFDDNNYKYDCIISNPPFSKRKEILEKLKQINKPFSLIVPLQTLTNNYFKSLFQDSVQVIVPNHRIGFIKNDVWTKGADFDTIILNYKMDLPKDIIYETETVPRPPNMFTCPNCNITITMRSKGSHIKSKNHKIKELDQNTETQS